MFAIQPINRFYSTKRYVGVRPDSNLPYLVYESNSDYPNSIHGFTTYNDALSYLTKIVNREDLDVCNLTTSQTIDLVLVDNANKFDIIEFEIAEGQLKILNTYPQTQFSRKDWY